MKKASKNADRKRADWAIEDGFISVKDAARFLGISKSSTYELIRSGIITYATIRGRKMVSRSALREYAKSRLVFGYIA